jgi:hypothetical protein
LIVLSSLKNRTKISNWQQYATSVLSSHWRANQRNFFMRYISYSSMFCDIFSIRDFTVLFDKGMSCISFLLLPYL